MDHLLTIILACSLHFDDSLVRAIVQKVSIANPFFVGDLATLDTYDGIVSVSEASRTVEAIVSHGGRPAVGLMGLPIAWAARYGRSVADLFDGCTNVAIGTAVLSAYEAECSHGTRPLRARNRSRRAQRASGRVCILTKMGEDLGLTGYPQGILPDLAKLESVRPDPNIDPPSARSQLYPDNTDHAALDEKHDWSNSRLYFSPPAPTAPPVPVSHPVSPSRIRPSASSEQRPTATSSAVEPRK